MVEKEDIRPIAFLEIYDSKSRIQLRLRNGSQRWRWRLRHENGNILASSGEGYSDRSEARRLGVAVCGGSYPFDIIDTK